MIPRSVSIRHLVPVSSFIEASVDITVLIQAAPPTTQKSLRNISRSIIIPVVHSMFLSFSRVKLKLSNAAWPPGSHSFRTNTSTIAMGTLKLNTTPVKLCRTRVKNEIINSNIMSTRLSAKLGYVNVDRFKVNMVVTPATGPSPLTMALPTIGTRDDTLHLLLLLLLLSSVLPPELFMELVVHRSRK